MRRIVSIVVLVLAGCGRSVLPDELTSGDAGSPMMMVTASAMAVCDGGMPLTPPPAAALCAPAFRTVEEVRRAMIGTWTGAVRSTSSTNGSQLAKVSFGEDGTLALDSQGTLAPRWVTGARFELNALTNTCDAKGLLFEPGEMMHRGFFWWVRPCGANRLAFTYSSVNAGLRVVHTFDLSR
jgi:hypothetical protein